MSFHFIVKDKAFYRKVLHIAVPIALQSLITIGVNMMDTVMLGSMGETQLSASSLSNQFVQVFQIFCMGLGMGASVLIARFWGMQDRENLRQQGSTRIGTLRLGLGFGFVAGLAGLRNLIADLGQNLNHFGILSVNLTALGQFVDSKVQSVNAGDGVLHSKSLSGF